MVLCFLSQGCTRSVVQQSKPPDPLLVSKKPLEGRATTALPKQAAHLGPQPPPAPGRDSTPLTVQRDLSLPVRPVTLDLPPITAQPSSSAAIR
jgi:hypothetical protein